MNTYWHKFCANTFHDRTSDVANTSKIFQDSKIQYQNFFSVLSLFCSQLSCFFFSSNLKKLKSSTFKTKQSPPRLITTFTTLRLKTSTHEQYGNKNGHYHFAHPVTPSHTQSHPVTPSHTQSHPVTPSHTPMM